MTYIFLKNNSAIQLQVNVCHSGKNHKKHISERLKEAYTT